MVLLPYEHMRLKLVSLLNSIGAGAVSALLVCLLSGEKRATSAGVCVCMTPAHSECMTGNFPHGSGL